MSEIITLLLSIQHTAAFRLLGARCLLLHSCMLLLETLHISSGNHTHRNLSWWKDLTIRAMIQVVSSGLVPSAPFPEVGGWKATILPSWRGSCFSTISRRVSPRTFVPRNDGVDGCGPADPRWVGVAVLRPLTTRAGVGGVDVESGECARGRLGRCLSVQR